MLLVYQRDRTSDSCFHWNEAILAGIGPSSWPLFFFFWLRVSVPFSDEQNSKKHSSAIRGDQNSCTSDTGQTHGPGKEIHSSFFFYSNIV